MIYSAFLATIGVALGVLALWAAGLLAIMIVGGALAALSWLRAIAKEIIYIITGNGALCPRHYGTIDACQRVSGHIGRCVYKTEIPK